MGTIYNSQIFNGVSVIGQVVKGLAKNGTIFYSYLRPETVNVIQYATLNGYTLPSEIYIKKLDNYIRDLKAFGLFNKLDFAYWMVGDGDMNFKTINIIDPTRFKGGLVGGLINTNQGIKGNALNAYIDTNFNPSVGSNKYKLIDAHRMAWVFESTVSTSFFNRTIDGMIGVTDNIMINLDTNGQFINQGQTSLNQSVNFDGLGFRLISRTSNSAVTLYDSTQEFIRTAPSQSPLQNRNQVIFARSTVFGGVGVSAYGLGASITGANAINYRTAILNNL